MSQVLNDNHLIIGGNIERHFSLLNDLFSLFFRPESQHKLIFFWSYNLDTDIYTPPICVQQFTS